MARDFSGTAQYLEYATAAARTSNPMSFSCWFNSDDTTLQFMVAVGDTDASDGRSQYLRLFSSTVQAGTDVGASEAAASSTTTYSTGVWHHGAAVFASTSDRRAFLDGGNKGTNTSSIPMPAVDNTTIGVRHSNNVYQFPFNGRIAEVGIWSVALTDAEVATLGDGYSPLLVRPESLVNYWPVYGKFAPEIDLIRSWPMANTGTTYADHVSVYVPWAQPVFVLQEPPLLLSVSDAVSVSDEVSLSISEGALTQAATDSITLGETVSLIVQSTPPVDISIIDGLTISEPTAALARAFAAALGTDEERTSIAKREVRVLVAPGDDPF